MGAAGLGEVPSPAAATARAAREFRHTEAALSRVKIETKRGGRERRVPAWLPGPGGSAFVHVFTAIMHQIDAEPLQWARPVLRRRGGWR